MCFYVLKCLHPSYTNQSWIPLTSGVVVNVLCIKEVRNYDTVGKRRLVCCWFLFLECLKKQIAWLNWWHMLTWLLPFLSKREDHHWRLRSLASGSPIDLSVVSSLFQENLFKFLSSVSWRLLFWRNSRLAWLDILVWLPGEDFGQQSSCKNVVILEQPSFCSSWITRNWRWTRQSGLFQSRQTSSWSAWWSVFDFVSSLDFCLRDSWNQTSSQHESLKNVIDMIWLSALFLGEFKRVVCYEFKSRTTWEIEMHATGGGNCGSKP